MLKIAFIIQLSVIVIIPSILITLSAMDNWLALHIEFAACTKRAQYFEFNYE